MEEWSENERDVCVFSLLISAPLFSALTTFTVWFSATAQMGRRIRGQRKGKGSIFKSHTAKRDLPAQYRPADFAERHGYIKGIVRDSE